VEPDRDAILKALENVIDPELRRPVTELDMVRSVEIDGGDVSVTIALTVAGCPLRESFEQQVVEHVGPVPGVERVRLGFDVMSPEEKATLTTKLRGGVEQRSKGISVDRSTWPPRSHGSATAPACSMRTSTAIRSRTCSGSRSAP
jgi:metal-sulfur cluster biosynthetic enzyme